MRILANRRAMVRPPAQDGIGIGIHPREAAHHHAEAAPQLLRDALADAAMDLDDVDVVAFSQGPGLGPCLRVAATLARGIATRYVKPLVGVNHCVAHLEIGAAVAPVTDPLLIYASGANTQIIAQAQGRYRVFGETLDVGLGNALDKFGRAQGLSFPGGPEIERLARQADPTTLLELPYVVKGMDMSFSGLPTAAARLLGEGAALPQVCHALQEHAFAALLETAERALMHTGKHEVILGGGVACNARLQAMAQSMADMHGVRLVIPPRDLLVDNGVMIAWLGHLRYQAGGATTVADATIRMYERTDHVAVDWRPSRPATTAPDGLRGAEATLEPGQYLGRDILRKRRWARAHVHPRLDAQIRSRRTRDEANILRAARKAGVRVPIVYETDLAHDAFVLERIAGPSLRAVLASDMDARPWMVAWGKQVRQLHEAGLAHGDLATGNVLVAPHGLVLIDFGLASHTQEAEAFGVDLHLVEEALSASRLDAQALFDAFVEGYGDGPHADAVRARLAAIRERGRYR